MVGWKCGEEVELRSRKRSWRRGVMGKGEAEVAVVVVVVVEWWFGKGGLEMKFGCERFPAMD